jgi:hypothetical protein
MNSAWEKFQSATLTLARSGSIKERLADAYRNYLVTVSEDDLPKELREEFRGMQRAINRERPMLRGEDSVRATVRKMSNNEADELASTVVRLFSAIPRSSIVRGERNGSGQVVPLYVAEPPAAAPAPKSRAQSG